MRKLWDSLNKPAGLLLLGFLVTTTGGATLNWVIQTTASDNERRFQMYKIRLDEAKLLQKELLESSTTRLFYLEQILSRLGDPDQKPESLRKYWNNKYSPVKDNWNRNLLRWQAQSRVLFSKDIPDAIVTEAENPLIVHDDVDENLDEAYYKKHEPRTVHGAFVKAHATIYRMVFKVADRRKCNNWSALEKLAEKQVSHLKSLHTCLSYRISGKLLVDPYGPKKEFTLPEECTSVQTNHRSEK